MITTITLWLQHTWATLATFIQHDWLFYIIAVPVVGAVAYAWSRLPALADEDDDEREAEYW
jgi:hypothetical protein